MWPLASSQDFWSPRHSAQSSIQLGLQVVGALGPQAWYQQKPVGITDRNSCKEKTQTSSFFTASTERIHCSTWAFSSLQRVYLYPVLRFDYTNKTGLNFSFIPRLTFSEEVLIYFWSSQSDVDHKNKNLELIFLIALKIGQMLCKGMIQTPHEAKAEGDVWEQQPALKPLEPSQHLSAREVSKSLWVKSAQEVYTGVTTTI